MKLHEPVKDFVPKKYPLGDVTQWYGENPQLYSQICNLLGCLTGGHNGIDIVRPWGEPLFCVEGGIVVEALNKQTGYGTHVRVLSDEGREWTYGHLSAIAPTCNYGERINAGDPIGSMGNTGFVVSGDTPYWGTGANKYQGTHLHLGYREVERWNGTGTWNVSYLSGRPDMIRANIKNYTNGTFGALPITADDFAAKEKDDVQDYIDTIAVLDKEAEKQTDPTIKSAFRQAVDKLLQTLASLLR